MDHLRLPGFSPLDQEYPPLSETFLVLVFILIFLLVLLYVLLVWVVIMRTLVARGSGTRRTRGRRSRDCVFRLDEV